LFGEDQGRYLIAAEFDAAEALVVAAGQAGIPIQTVGRFGGTSFAVGGASTPMAELEAIWRGAFAGAVG
ncbi:MAG: hypothetical protein AAFX00_11545, partial [Pseudomonadota bacterium]